MSNATREQFNQVRNDPYVKAALERSRLANEEVARASAEAMRRRGMTGHTPHVEPPKLSFRRDDPNPWPGKPKVPAMLVQMGLEGKGLGLKTNRQRHEALIAEACSRCGGGPDDTRSVTVWTNKMAGFALTNCRRLMDAAGYKVPKAVDTVSSFFKVIEAGLQQAAPEQTGHFSKTYGHGLHAVTFFSANEMLYRGERFNLQWRKAGRACDPINGSATVAGTLDARPIRKGLKALLVECKSITADEWRAVKQAAQEAEQQHREVRARQSVRAAQNSQVVEQQAEIDRAIDFDSMMD